ncbi:MAG: hypothetical protein H6965_06200 [Chromatiaceae bacterium]|nr:hypothetical protein [Chromatiaceae bacterium]
MRESFIDHSGCRSEAVQPGSIRGLPTVGLAVLVVLVLLLTLHATAVAAADSNAGTGSPLLFILSFTAGIITISVAIIFGLTHWSHKQDRIQSMLPFCIRYLVESKNESEKIQAAATLGQSKDPGALLILVDVVNNEKASEALHDAAYAALQEMAHRYRKYSALIKDILTATAEKEHARIIELLIENFENQNRKYVQSAFVIGCEYMRLAHYSEARAWLQTARIRNRKTPLYVNQISQRIRSCSEQLFKEGDVLFKVGEYYEALERYALASHDMEINEKHRYLAHLRLAGVYCKLERYEDAYQETLLALQDHDETETSLEINKLLQQMRAEIGTTAEAQKKRDRLATEISALVDNAMARLS